MPKKQKSALFGLYFEVYPTDCSIRVYQSMLFQQAYLCPMQPFMFGISIPSIKLTAEDTN